MAEEGRAFEGAIRLNIARWHGDMTRRAHLIEPSDTLARRFDRLPPEAASAAPVLSLFVEIQRLG